MCVVVKLACSDVIMLFVKGADSTLFPLIKQDAASLAHVNACSQSVAFFANKGA